MGDFGIKITKKGKDISSTNPDDYILWTKYKPFMLIGSREDTVVLEHGFTDGTYTVEHGYDFTPFVIMYANDTFVPYYGEYDIYYEYYRWYDSGGEFVSEGVSARIDSENIYFDWWSFSWNPQEEGYYPATTYDGQIVVKTYFYNLELGRQLPD